LCPLIHLRLLLQIYPILLFLQICPILLTSYLLPLQRPLFNLRSPSIPYLFKILLMVAAILLVVSLRLLHRF
jgi:hypothetical protein